MNKYLLTKRLRALFWSNELDIIREIEEEIDKAHVKIDIFKISRDQAIFDFIRVFEDACRLTLYGLLLKNKTRSEYGEVIRKYIDCISYGIKWINDSCPQSNDNVIRISLHNTIDYDQAHALLINHALPYSKICEGYIGLSRKCYDFKYNRLLKTVKFVFKKNRINGFISDTLEFISRRSDIELDSSEMVPYDAMQKLISSVRFDIDRFQYRVPDKLEKYYYSFALKSWDSISQLPTDWKFDNFNLGEFRLFWGALATISYIHFYACIFCKERFGAVNHCVLMLMESEVVKRIKMISGLNDDTIILIIEFLTYDSQVTNNDIFIQPFIKIASDMILVSPSVIINSNAERNLVALLEKKRDSSFSRLSNTFEQIMQNTLDAALIEKGDLLVKHNINIRNDLPDIDYLLYDIKNCALFVAELKWLNEPDSAKEVFAKEQEIEKGCGQIRSIVKYLKDNSSGFLERKFGVKVDRVKIYYCVVSKYSTRSQSDDIPVIALDNLLKLIKHNRTIEWLEIVAHKDYMKKKPSNYKMGFETTKYAGYKFKTPVLKRYII